MAYIYFATAQNNPHGVHAWEGLVNNKNFRDLGTSLNTCLGREAFRPGVLLRSNEWFSGWSCNMVNNPERIFSLNYIPEDQDTYFCVSDDHKLVVGEFYNTERLHDIEFFDNWDKPNHRDNYCRFISNILQAVISEQRVLYHCEAGRDRTGAVSGILGALGMEVLVARGLSEDTALDALECDYRKSASLRAHKHGRIAQFVRLSKEEGGMSTFLRNRCGIDAAVFSTFAAKFLN